MLSHDMEKLLTFATERQTALMQEAAVAHLLNQQKSRRYMVTWPQALRYWWRRLTFARPTYQPSRHALAES